MDGYRKFFLIMTLGLTLAGVVMVGLGLAIGESDADERCYRDLHTFATYKELHPQIRESLEDGKLSIRECSNLTAASSGFRQKRLQQEILNKVNK